MHTPNMVAGKIPILLLHYTILLSKQALPEFCINTYQGVKMNLFTKIASAATATVAALAFSVASAAVVVTSPNGSTELDTGNPIIIGNDDLAPGMFEDVTSFDVASPLASAVGSVDVRFSSGVPAGVANMFMTYRIAGLADQTFQVTNSSGLQILDFFSLDIIAGIPVEVIISGFVFENLGQQANYDIVITADAIPLPAAGVFLLTGLAGAAGLRFRKKAA